MLIKINGEEIDVAEASTIQDVIDETDAPYTPGSIVCLIKGKKELEKNISKYKIKTNKGSIVIQLDESDEAKPLVDVWKNQYDEFVDLNIRWSTTTEVAIGPIVTDLEPTSEEYKYDEGDVVLSLSSFSNESTHLILLKENTTNVYSVPPYNKGIFAQVIGGRKTLENLTDDDLVTGIEPIIERSTTTDIESISDLTTVLEEGNELYTYISFEVDEESPVCVEHLFALIKDGKMQVSYESESFLGFYELACLEKPKEHTTKRNRGTITVRNDGVGVLRHDSVSESLGALRVRASDSEVRGAVKGDFLSMTRSADDEDTVSVHAVTFNHIVRYEHVIVRDNTFYGIDDEFVADIDVKFSKVVLEVRRRHDE